MTFRAIVVNKTDAGFTAGLQDTDESALSPGDVELESTWSSVNYKDGLALIPNGGVIRSFPMIPGIDVAGRVTGSSDSRFSAGQEVFVTGYGTGVSHTGGFAERARMPADWTLPLPAGLTARDVMAIGTAGFTAALSVHALEQHGLKPGNGPVLVTGATGGVGSVAVEILGRLGYEVVAATGKAEQADWLRSLGASDVIGRDVVMAESTRPLESERWAGVVDPVGGAATAYAIRTTKYFGGIALSGNTGGRDVSTTVLPFILRGVALLGIDSVMCPRELRSSIWQRLGADLKPEKLLGSKIEEIGLDGVIEAGERIRGGQVVGRILVRLDA